LAISRTPRRSNGAGRRGDSVRLRPGAALRDSLREGYGLASLRADLLAGAVVGVVALPLSMALAIAVDVPPQHGLYTAIVAGAAIALLGGSRVQVSGPTAAFVAVLAPITATYGVGGLLLATLMAGAILIVLAVSGLGKLIELVPYPVTTGFTAGIGIVIAILQVRDALGLTVAAWPESALEKAVELARALPTARAADAGIAALTLAILLLWPRVQKSIPAPLIALSAAAVAAALLARYAPDLAVATIRDRFSTEIGGVVVDGIPRMLPQPVLPWRLPGPDGAPLELSWELVRALLPAAGAIAVLGAIESLLSAVVADGMTRRQHDPDAELLGQGLGNLVAPFFGGIAATGAIARTATNVRSGARTPIAAITHSAVLLLSVLALAPLLGYLPMSALAALLLVVAWTMSDAPHVARTLRTAPRSDVAVLLVCLALTVVFDMVLAIGVGVVLAALLFMRRMAAVSSVRVLGEHHPEADRPVPPGMLVYEVAGPLFFGAAARAMRALATTSAHVRVVLIDLRAVPAMDATGQVNLASAVERLRHAGISVVIAGIASQPLRTLLRAGWQRRGERLAIHRSFEQGFEAARSAAQSH
jgi:sulfate permease, SulP family